MDRFTAMRMFVRVVELQSFTKAAITLKVPKSTVSANLQELESLLQVKLLNRTTRHVSPTADGAAYFERAVRLLQDLEETEAAVRHAVKSPSGKLRVDMPTVIAQRLVMPNLPHFFSLYPDIRLEVGCSDRPVHLIQEGVDCVVRGGVLQDMALVARKIADLDNITCAAPAYLARCGRPRSLSDLETHTFVNYFSDQTGKQFSNDFEKDGLKHSIKGKHMVAVNDSEAYIAGGIAGLGLIQMPRFAVRQYIDSGQLEPVMTQYGAGSTPIYVLYPSNRHLSTKVRAFSDWVASLFKSVPA
jgi:LysR family transcriptional regulator for bpeEF and oprC